MLLPAAFGLSFTQAEVDFVIPNLKMDIPLAIDPFLLFKSRDPYLRGLHTQMVSIFNQGIELYQNGDRRGLDRLIQFPEIDEIGFGYSDQSIRGRGLGTQLNSLLAETLAASPELQARGLRHVEELQLVSLGVGPDRVSDIAGNALKSYLIEYTQRQAELWGIPLVSNMPINHFFDYQAWDWSEGHFDLPRNPVSGLPIVLVPRRMVRLLPWINYRDFVRTDMRMFLRAETSRSASRPRRQTDSSKTTVIGVTRSQLKLVDQYVARKEQEGARVEPALIPEARQSSQERTVGERLIGRLAAIPSGTKGSSEYQRTVFEILNLLFEPDLTDGQLEEETHLHTERRDIVYTNESYSPFLSYVRDTYKSFLLLFECKNVAALEIDHINQVATYLGANLGLLGFIVTRKTPGDNIVRKTYAVANNTPGVPKKTILVLTDENLSKMIQMTNEGKSPVRHLQELYRGFQGKIQ